MPSTKTKKFGNKKGKKARRENRALKALKKAEAAKAKFRLKLPSYESQERPLAHGEASELFMAFAALEHLPATLMGLEVFETPRNVEWENECYGAAKDADSK